LMPTPAVVRPIPAAAEVEFPVVSAAASGLDASGVAELKHLREVVAQLLRSQEELQCRVLALEKQHQAAQRGHGQPHTGGSGPSPSRRERRRWAARRFQERCARADVFHARSVFRAWRRAVAEAQDVEADGRPLQASEAGVADSEGACNAEAAVGVDGAQGDAEGPARKAGDDMQTDNGRAALEPSASEAGGEAARESGPPRQRKAARRGVGDNAQAAYAVTATARRELEAKKGAGRRPSVETGEGGSRHDDKKMRASTSEGGGASTSGVTTVRAERAARRLERRAAAAHPYARPGGDGAGVAAA
jgi:hypothetical protein